MDSPTVDVLAGLKDFQQDTVEFVFEKMFRQRPPVHRFLVADEVGLGKTLVARGLVARAVEELSKGRRSINVVYVCSNVQIARQNIQRLQKGLIGKYLKMPDRVTMLPTVPIKSGERVNIIAATPGTSFDVKEGGGMWRERAVVRMMLEAAWGPDLFRSQGSYRIFQGHVSNFNWFKSECLYMNARHLGVHTQPFVGSFRRELKAASPRNRSWTFLDRYLELLDIYQFDRPVNGWSDEERAKRHRFVGELRDVLARACIKALKPDLVILDEFQRFRHLMAEPDAEDDSPGAALARDMFQAHPDTKVLLLSATPYRLYDDTEGHHYSDLLETVRFLLDDEAELEVLRSGLRDFRRGLFRLGDVGRASCIHAKDRIQSVLSSVMVRTERLASTPDRSGMLTEIDLRLTPTAEDVTAYHAVARLAAHVEAPDPLEYWKSAPFLTTFADDYVLGRQLRDSIEGGRVDHRLTEGTQVPFGPVERYEEIAIPNARLRWLVDDVVSSGAQDLLWLPPSLPYMEPRGPFVGRSDVKKRLVFSAWAMVPTAVSTLVSYEVERRMVSTRKGPTLENNPIARRSAYRPLDWTISDERLSNMPMLAFLYPSVTLSHMGDPLAQCALREGMPVPMDEAIGNVRAKISENLTRLVDRIEAHGGAVAKGGRTDERWYWMAPLLLDQETLSFTDPNLAAPGWFARVLQEPEPRQGDRADADEPRESTGLRRHLEEASHVFTERVPKLGRMPSDLAQVLAELALAAPGNVVVRMLGRVLNTDTESPEVRRSAATVAWGFRTLFNAPEVVALIRRLYRRGPYWRQALRYCLDGNLQSVIDEYGHVLLGSLGDVSGDESAIEDLCKAMREGMRVRTVNYRVRGVEPTGLVSHAMRTHFALPLQDGRTDEGTQTRLADVRMSFNSPFWPFIVVSTSIGQEGLDFHQYCHSVVHWNVPSNPVDLEQREGRVHRYMGLAVRKNIGADFGDLGRRSRGDPWKAMMEAAERARGPATSDIVPYWVFPREGGASIERVFPAMSLSRDVAVADSTVKALAAYRLAFGQPRQDDLVRYLKDHVPEDQLRELVSELAIDLSPPRRTNRKRAAKP